MTPRRRPACARAPKRCKPCCRRSRKADGRTELNEKSTMRLSQSLIAASIVVALSVVLAGCSSNLGSNFDPSDLLDFLDTKKKLPGKREPVFPNGVPGLEQGVPKELYKGAQEQPDPNAQTATAAPPPPVEEPKAEKSKGHKGTRRAAPDAAQQPAAEADPNAPSESDGAAAAVPPPPKHRKIVRRRTTAPPPDQQAAPPTQPAAPAQQSAAPTEQQSAAPFPAPLPSTFQR